MGVSCDLQVDVNGDEVFMVNKDVVSTYSGRINKLFAKSKGVGTNFKVIFNEFPGGAESFELMIRFCYKKGRIDVNPLNISILYCVANYMEMNQSVCGMQNLLEMTEKSLKVMRYWTWSDLLVALRQCQELLPVSGYSGVVDKCLDSIVGKIAHLFEPSSCPSTSSPDSLGYLLPFDTRSTESLKNVSSRMTCWFEDFVAFGPLLIRMFVKSMVAQNFDHGVISRFLFYYQKARFVEAGSDDKFRIMDAIVEILYSLDHTAVSCKSLFGLLRVTLSIKLSEPCRGRLECMIGSQLDQATLDNLLVPSPVWTKYMYDVNLVLRLSKSFLSKGACHLPFTRLKRVSTLMDLYLAEVAPDPRLKPSKFSALIMSLPHTSRDSYDGMYHAIDIYLEVHSGLSEEEKIKVCSGLNFEKLSSEAFQRLAQNAKFPLQLAKQALVSQQCRLKSLLQTTSQSISFDGLPCSFLERKGDGEEDGSCQQIVVYAGKLDLTSENEKLKSHLQGMQCRVLELENVCRSMQMQMTKIMRARLASHNKAKSVPRLCS